VKTQDYAPLYAKLGVRLDEKLTAAALTHRSFINELGSDSKKSGARKINSQNENSNIAGDSTAQENYERLEFLGDSVVGLIITEEIFHRFPELDEGRLSPIRSGVVNTKALAQIARNWELGKYLILGNGEEVTNGREKTSILADCCEALIGAIYLAHGLTATKEIVLREFAEIIDSAATMGSAFDGKTALQDLCAAKGWAAPTYSNTDTGPDHDKEFTATVLVNGEALAQGVGKSKREAEQAAARTAFALLN
jgi:ribonuclease III